MKKQASQCDIKDGVTHYDITTVVRVSVVDIDSMSDAELMERFYPQATISHIRSTLVQRMNT